MSETVRPGLNNQPWFTAPPSRLHAVGRWIWTVLLCGYFAFSYGSDNMFLRLDRYTAGLERRPYQYRVLMIPVFRAGLHVPLLVRVGSRMQALQHDPYRLIFILIAFAAILATVISTRFTLERLTGDSVFSFWFALLSVPMAEMLLATTWGPSFALPYDAPSLAFFAIGILLILSRRWLWYYPVFVLAVLNRETACFLAVFFAVWEWVRMRDAGVAPQSRLRRIAPGFVAQAILWLAIKAVLAHAFSGNPSEGSIAGGLFITKLPYNLHELSEPWQWPLLASVGGFLLPFLWLGRRFIACNPLRAATFVVIPLSFLGLLMVGVIVEIRIFADWVAMIVPCLGMIVFHCFRPVALPTTEG